MIILLEFIESLDLILIAAIRVVSGFCYRKRFNLFRSRFGFPSRQLHCNYNTETPFCHDDSCHHDCNYVLCSLMSTMRRRTECVTVTPESSALSQLSWNISNVRVYMGWQWRRSFCLK